MTDKRVPSTEPHDDECQDRSPYWDHAHLIWACTGCGVPLDEDEVERLGGLQSGVPAARSTGVHLLQPRATNTVRPYTACTCGLTFADPNAARAHHREATVPGWRGSPVDLREDARR